MNQRGPLATLPEQSELGWYPIPFYTGHDPTSNMAPTVIQPKPCPSRVRLLSPRELDVAQLIAQGDTDREIADQVYLSFRTVNHYAENIRKKLGARNRVQVAVAVSEATRAS